MTHLSSRVLLLLLIFGTGLLGGILLLIRQWPFTAPLPFVLISLVLAVFALSLTLRPQHGVLTAAGAVLCYGLAFFALPLLIPGDQYPILDLLGYRQPWFIHFGWMALLLAAGLVAARVSHLLRTMERKLTLHTAAQSEPLKDSRVGLPNESLFLLELEQEIARCRRFGREFALLHVELKYLEQMEKHHGLQMVEKAERLAAQALKDGLRFEDYVGYAGEGRFLVMARETDLSGANYCARRILGLFARVQLGSVAKKPLKLRAEIGAASYPLDSDEAFSLIEHARLNVLHL